MSKVKKKHNKRWTDYSEIKLMCKSFFLLLIPHGTTLTYQIINQFYGVFYTSCSHLFIGIE